MVHSDAGGLGRPPLIDVPAILLRGILKPAFSQTTDQRSLSLSLMSSCTSTLTFAWRGRHLHRHIHPTIPCHNYFQCTIRSFWRLPVGWVLEQKFRATPTEKPVSALRSLLRAGGVELELELSKRLAKRALSIPGKVAFDSNVWSERAKTGKTTA